jgi:hypothetical protein
MTDIAESGRLEFQRLALIFDLVGFLPLSFSHGICTREEDFVVTGECSVSLMAWPVVNRSCIEAIFSQSAASRSQTSLSKWLST